MDLHVDAVREWQWAQIVQGNQDREWFAESCESVAKSYQEQVPQDNQCEDAEHPTGIEFIHNIPLAYTRKFEHSKTKGKETAPIRKRENIRKVNVACAHSFSA